MVSKTLCGTLVKTILDAPERAKAATKVLDEGSTVRPEFSADKTRLFAFFDVAPIKPALASAASKASVAAASASAAAAETVGGSLQNSHPLASTDAALSSPS